jgi:Family of unknown function (DUF6069)
MSLTTTRTVEPDVRAPSRGLFATGLLATLAATAATTATAAAAMAVGVDFEIPDGGERIPLPGFATVTGVFSIVGVLIALTLRRWSPRPATWFGRTTVPLTVISLVPPVTSGADAATTTALIVLHLVAASVMIPTMVRRLTADDRVTRERPGPGT